MSSQIKSDIRRHSSDHQAFFYSYHAIIEISETTSQMKWRN